MHLFFNLTANRGVSASATSNGSVTSGRAVDYPLKYQIAAVSRLPITQIIQASGTK
jgi:hypothetical protein